MRRRSRAWRVLKWVGTVVVLLLLCAWIGSYFSSTWISDQDTCVLRLQGGCLEIGWVHNNVSRVDQIDVKMGFGPSRFEFRLSGQGPLWPRVHRNPNYWWLMTPLWMPFIVVAIPTLLLWRRDRRRRPGHCKRCGYDLTGNVSGRCPECGTAVVSRGSQERSDDHATA